ncbi:2-succinyl-5-enolpyruvyl-6-hydroxy-3-cyclohexene-1-carboxylic-acid synthase [Galbibacter sp.]|uniref:2-succinyl-5-enolpyruvyl-6-hydroxy-3- cyclohexene-1-carboxylic-acid synthase n=1 Tax=Galbibacter sp. TaxID=2918471 RepID=UPI002C412EAE|nr:2-succinyl-5-enolpyruvyl-6-hydroxy-3-cyclohexene-1-carboxylic-acid synthase [Galbibacter sp.]HLV63410.1 2-succinyl-5-enolpyruvyl-6-hydroxy-3-cyclohexene-1-carboxylic-acid synthase [Galbibacter sp.]
MKRSSIVLAQTVSELCKLKEIQHIIISPGSRNAPLTISFTEDPYFKTYSIVDERSAGFFALGIAQQLKKPVALLCTSGSALLNYYPAISEAFYSDIPLVVLSADRPASKIDIGDGQTIRQDNVYDRHILYSANLKEDNCDFSDKTLGKKTTYNDHQKANEVKINHAINIAITENGPVHINIPFEEPLYHSVDQLLVQPEVIPPSQKDWTPTAEDLLPYSKIWNSVKKKMVLVGVHSPDALPEEILEKLANDASVIVFTETTSNLHHSNFFPNIDKIIAPLELNKQDESYFKELQPDVLLTFGGMVVSKKIKAFLRNYQPKHHWHIDPKKAYDTFYCLERHFKTKPSVFLATFLKQVKPKSSGQLSAWLKVKANRSVAHKQYLTQLPFSDFSVYERILKTIPDQYQLQLSNSSTIRYAQLFQLNDALQVFCNRGTSGIDGSISTAIGAAVAGDRPVLMITGDLSFFYDSNALWNNYIPANFRIIIINNQGGGIFRILPGDKNTDTFSTYFETKHTLKAKGICETFGIEYLSVGNQEELDTQLIEFYKSSQRPKLLEIHTPRLLNDEILLGYFKYLAQN